LIARAFSSVLTEESNRHSERPMRITLVYPPPWKIRRPGDAPFPSADGTPRGFDDQAFTQGDFVQAPYGLLSIAAQALAAGHLVATLNLSNACWRDVEQAIRNHPAELFGLSCITANRRGVALLAGLIRDLYPQAHITAGGPHVTAQPRETLSHYQTIDTIVLGEGEATFMALIDCLSAGTDAVQLPGTAWRQGKAIAIGPPRPAIRDLDRLVSPLDFFNMRTIVTSRGCPGRCTFCSSHNMWGRTVRMHSATYVLEMLAVATQRHGQRFIAIKDDTFTAHRRRVLQICAEIQKRRLDLAWSCETRADHLDEEMLRAMRRAGCQRISLGVESGSPAILQTIRKGIALATVRQATREAQKYGLQVRYYLMVGNRGENWDTFRQSLGFIAAARPNQYVFSQLHLYPGTEEYALCCRQGVIAADIYFHHDGPHLTCFAGAREDEMRIRAFLKEQEGVQVYRQFSSQTCQAILARLPDLHWAHMDLAAAYIRERRLAQAEHHLDQAAHRQFGFPGLVLNARACIAAGRGQIQTAEDLLLEAVERYPHAVVIANLKRLAQRQSEANRAVAGPLALNPGEGFETSYPCRPPESPEPHPHRRGLAAC
jgi:radical SAM superfamily enzyme YgiQ (UPF0313 family)